VQKGDYTIEENIFDNAWCGYTFLGELPSTGGPVISFKNNTFKNNTHGDVMIFRENTTDVVYDLKDNGLENASIKTFDFKQGVGLGEGTIEQWTTSLDRSPNNNIVLNVNSPAIIDLGVITPEELIIDNENKIIKINPSSNLQSAINKLLELKQQNSELIALINSNTLFLQDGTYFLDRLTTSGEKISIRVLENNVVRILASNIE
jgi:hypothetical protein